MNRIDTRFEHLRSAGRTGLIPFFTAGDPSIGSTVPVMHALVAAGADVLELGVPFSDPMADGPAIQQSSERALARKVGATRVLDFVREFRRSDADTPVVLMGYLNPVEIYGVERYARDAQAAGVDGLLLVDCPPEEADTVRDALDRHAVHQICLAAPTSGESRLDAMLANTRGYLYYVSFAGVTGAARLELDDVRAKVAQIRARTTLPIAVGFGVRDAESAVAIGSIADAVVIGSALVLALQATAEQGGDVAATATAFLAPIRAALDAA
jgi:tryptophan synthase alpha chain